MAWNGIMATLNDCLYKAGANVSATSGTEAYGNLFVTQAESYINNISNYNYSDAYAALNADKKSILTEYVSSFVAAYMIQYDMSGYTSRMEAQTMLNILWARMEKIEAQLKVPQAQVFLKAA